MSTLGATKAKDEIDEESMEDEESMDEETTDEESMEDESTEDDESAEGDEEAADEDEESDEDDEEEESPAAQKAARQFLKSNPRAARAIMRMGALAERDRIAAISEAADLHPHARKLARKAMFSSSMSPGDFALEAMRQSKTRAKARKQKIDADGARVPTMGTTGGTKADALEERALAHARTMAGGKG